MLACESRHFYLLLTVIICHYTTNNLPLLLEFKQYNMETNSLLKVSTYAKSIGKSTETVRKWIRSGMLKEGDQYVVIDGVTFINPFKIGKQ